MMKLLVTIALSCGILASAVAAQNNTCTAVVGQQCGNSAQPREKNCCAKGYCQPWNTGYYQCLDSLPLCPVQETDIDFVGNDMRTVYGLTPAKCCDECYITEGCAAYTFVNQNPDGKTACYLKKSAAGRAEKKGAVSAAVVPPAPPAKCPTIERGVDYVGNDITNVRFGDLNGCCDACASTAGCAAFSFKQYDWDGKSSCYLKKSAAGRATAVSIISGKVKDVVTSPPTTSPPTPTPSTSAPPVDHCPVQEKDIDYQYNDLKNIKGISISQCCDECAKTPLCIAYTFVEKNDDGKTACYLKNGYGGSYKKVGAISAKLKCPNTVMGQCGSSATGALCCPEGSFCQPWNPWYYQCIPNPPAEKCPTVTTGIDFYGNDVGVVFGLLPEGCCDACYKNKDCHVWTFVNYNADGRSACYLKSSITDQRKRIDAISGYKSKLASM